MCITFPDLCDNICLCATRLMVVVRHIQLIHEAIRLCISDSQGRRWMVFMLSIPLFVTNIHLDSGQNWLDFNDQRSKVMVTVPHCWDECRIMPRGNFSTSCTNSHELFRKFTVAMSAIIALIRTFFGRIICKHRNKWWHQINNLTVLQKDVTLSPAAGLVDGVNINFLKMTAWENEGKFTVLLRAACCCLKRALTCWLAS